MALVALYSEMTAGKGFHHLTLNLNEIVSCHSIPFRRLPMRGCVMRVGLETARFIYQRTPYLSIRKCRVGFP